MRHIRLVVFWCMMNVSRCSELDWLPLTRMLRTRGPPAPGPFVGCVGRAEASQTNVRYGRRHFRQCLAWASIFPVARCRSIVLRATLVRTDCCAEATHSRILVLSRSASTRSPDHSCSPWQGTYLHSTLQPRPFPLPLLSYCEFHTAIDIKPNFTLSCAIDPPEQFLRPARRASTYWTRAMTRRNWKT